MKLRTVINLGQMRVNITDYAVLMKMSKYQNINILLHIIKNLFYVRILDFTQSIFY